ncbi:MAG: hypothetical protein K2K05_09715, partial [Muribaculaceae bacterium]|nr:hypothetical protein [Muribaculaceae bacterium]
YKGTTDGRLDALEQFKTSWESILPTIQQNAADALAQANKNKTDIEALNDAIEALKQADEDLKAADAAQQVIIDDILEKLEGFVSTEDFNEAIEALKAKDAEIEKLAKENYSKAIGYTNLMIEQVLAKMNTQFDALNKEITDIKAFQTDLAAEVAKNTQAISALQTSINEANVKINELSLAISAVTDRAEEIAGRITSIVLQGTKDEVFGTLRLPIGIQSNLLVSYFGEAINDVTFPLVARTAGTYNGEYYNVLTQEEANVLGVSNAEGARVPIETISGLYMKEAADGNGFLGNVYATINPSSVNVQDPKFEYNLVNSRGQKVAEPMKFVPCDEVLNFGFSRADNNNGFYKAEASVKVDEASINSIRFHFDDNLKTAVKDILKAPKASANKQTVLKLANLVYDQLNGFLPA